MNGNCNIVCVHCGAEASDLYRNYGKNVIKLCECSECGKTVDPYIEYDRVLIFIDLLLQYTAAYRHLFVNQVYRSFWRLACIFVICEAYRKWAIRMETYNKSVTEGFINLEWKFYECLVESSVETAVFALSTLGLSLIFNLGTRLPPSSVFWITCCGFYGKIFVLFSVIWNLHHKYEYLGLIELFILISNYQTQNLMYSKSPKLNILVVLLSWTLSYGAGLYCHRIFDFTVYF
ncbi:unnamed protein product [Bursaphelenchus xylophilus]|uniref:Protein ARV n=1 Tax=Bursaphelenchus xylophilus TaxID=6326 RepID=A0A1I7SVU1_BURXY|nr:unnamed protein product [Bursaphelenchus xylophilus]CAG9098273.1 unnamed protein product [Bursaphelenchus xylophilus]